MKVAKLPLSNEQLKRLKDKTVQAVIEVDLDDLVSFNLGWLNERACQSIIGVKDYVLTDIDYRVVGGCTREKGDWGSVLIEVTGVVTSF